MLCYNNNGDSMDKKIEKNDLKDVISISKKILKLFYVILIVIGIYVLLKIIKGVGALEVVINLLKILSPLFIGIIVAWLLNPFVKWLEKKNVRRGIAASLSYVILVAAIFLLIKAIIPLLYNQTIELVGNFPNIFQSLKDWFSGLLNNFNSNMINVDNVEKTLLLKLDEISGNLSTSMPTFIIGSVTSVASSIGTFVIGLVIGFYLLLGFDNLESIVFDIIPKKIRKSSKELGTKVNQSLRNYVNGAFIDSCVVFLISTIAFALIGLKSPILFGLFCGLMNVIPYAGPYIGGAPAVIVAFSQGVGIGIAVLIAIIIIQLIEGNVLQTLIISKTTKLNPVIIIIGLLIFGHFFGIIGMLLSTPIIGVCKVIITYFDEKYDLLNFN